MVLFEGRDRLLGLPGRFRVVRCKHCGLVYTNPRPTQAEMKAYYAALYPPHQVRGNTTGPLRALRLRQAVLMYQYGYSEQQLDRQVQVRLLQKVASLVSSLLK